MRPPLMPRRLPVFPQRQILLDPRFAAVALVPPDLDRLVLVLRAVDCGILNVGTKMLGPGAAHHVLDLAGAQRAMRAQLKTTGTFGMAFLEVSLLYRGRQPLSVKQLNLLKHERGDLHVERKVDIGAEAAFRHLWRLFKDLPVEQMRDEWVRTSPPSLATRPRA